MSSYQDFYSEKEEQSYEARIWWVFWVVAVIVIAYTVWHQYRNYDLVHNGTCIEAEYMEYNGQELARYRDETGRVVASVNLDGMNAIHDEDTILLYYKDNINFAEPKRNPKAWICSYIIFGLLLAGTSYKLYTIYKHKPSSERYPEWHD